MTSLPEGAVDSKLPDSSSSASNQAESNSNSSTSFLFSSIFTSPFSIFESNPNLFSTEKKDTKPRTNEWTKTIKRIMTGGAMRRIQERILGTGRIDTLSPSSETWLLGVCYKVAAEESSSSSTGDDADNTFSAFVEDFSSRIWITYRKGFEAMGEARYTSDVNWGCMIRSSQMLVAQALIFHYLGRSWRKPAEKPYNQNYIKILHQFGDSESHAFSIHNLVRAGKEYGLAAGSWLGPYAMCRAWETLARENNVGESEAEKRKESLPFVIYVVSGDGDGERGGAPVLCRDVASRLSSEFSKRGATWAPMLLLVPLVLGLDKVNPRYLPLLKETFMFPQSLGILGGKPGASTYIVGVQDEKALYLDPHEVQPAVDIESDNLEADTSSYHCSTVRHIPLDQIDPSLAIGFYCRDKDDFHDLCSRSSELGEKANGAPLFTVTDSLGASSSNRFDDAFNLEQYSEYSGHAGEDEWQLL
ncbi:hypothetical protein LUZ63_011155 [Rhynchospora breviuscula]|uniref:Cysteine protease n=1 Tax=Rhynchospora breviuscula TaxID=2022672 RepID=A0A9Q0CI81_9POAL|nr:hypothetical protein LUZ63_011155 [Rhynchospora breviuscula]